MSTPAQFAGKASAFGPDLQKNLRDAVNKAAFTTKGAIVTAARGRGWPVKPWMVHYRMIDTPAGPTAHLKSRGGKIKMFEFGAKPHEIGGAFGKGRTKAGNRRRSRSSPVLAGNLEHPVVGPIQHPGFQGRPFWDQGVAASRPAVSAIVRASTRQTMIEIFGR